MKARYTFFFYGLISLQLLLGCSPKSYCFLVPQNGVVFISDSSAIKSVTVTQTTPDNRSVRKVIYNVILDPPSKEFRIPHDSLINGYVEISISTTDYRDLYVLKVHPEDWLKDTIRFRAMMR